VSSTSVGVVDSGLSNLDSVRRALEVCGASVVVAREPDDLDDVERVVLPGVGAFGDAMVRLKATGFVVALRELAATDDVPILGVCLGMQLLATTGEEFGEHHGLGLVPGAVVKIRPQPGERIPHIGWNEVRPTRPGTLFEAVDGKDFYFVHSYHFVPDDPADLTATTPFAGGVAAAVGRGLVQGTQFHPEKSQAAGFAVLRAFLEL
jgi:glutamine amidotransferase